MAERELYMEIVGFLVSSGGTYQYLDDFTCREVLSALDDGRFRLVRDGSGVIKSFSVWWMIHAEDLEAVKQGGRPADVRTGSIVYIADHAGRGTYTGLMKFIRATIAKKGVCWHHRKRLPELFRYYPNKEGVNHA
jgi:hypothetical protein